MAQDRKCVQIKDAYQLKERKSAYNVHLLPKQPQLSRENNRYWDINTCKSKVCRAPRPSARLDSRVQ